MLTNSKAPDCTFNRQEDLFSSCGDTQTFLYQYEENDLRFMSNYFSNSFNASLLSETAGRFYELSADAFDILIHAWMSELPVEKEILAFGRKVMAAAQTVNAPEEKRLQSEAAAVDRSDSDALAVLNAAAKVQYEIHRMLGLLRFSPDADGVYTAICAPDHLIIPALGEHLTARFGDMPWAVIDEKRSLRISREPPEQAKITGLETCGQSADKKSDEWEELWKHYHKTINNESRKNPRLQRQFMPKRYWKYLPEAD